MGKLVPWSSWDEWKAVCAGLFSSNDNHRMAAVAQVEIWRARGRVPLAAEVSAALVETTIKDSSAEEGPDDGFSHSECALRSQYALAIIRMVNGITDSQQKGRVAVSVASLASAAGLPRLLVDLRHEATHNELPSLQVLRLAGQQALAWLRTNYWDAQRAQLQSSSDKVAGLLAALQQSFTAASSKALGHQQAADSSDEEEGASQDTGGYQAADGQKQRKQLVNDLRSMVPPACGAWLADAILDGTAVGAPPAAPARAAGVMISHAGVMISHAGGRAPSSMASIMACTSSQQGDAARAAAKGWQSCLATLVKSYPTLLPLLLKGAVRRLSAGAAAAAGAAALPGSSVGQEQRWQRWVAYLLDISGSAASKAAAAQQGKKRSRSNSSLADLAAGGSSHSSLRYTPTAAQLRQLLAAALAGYSSASKAGAAGRVRQLLELCGKLAGQLSAAQQVQKKPDHESAELVTLAQMVSAAASVIKPAAGKAAVGAVPGADDLAAARASQQDLLAQLAALSQAEAGTAPAAPAADAPEGAPQEAAAPAKRWKRCSSWQPCAIGCLPDAFDANRRPFRLSSRFASTAAAACEQQGQQEGPGGQDASQSAAHAGAEMDAAAEAEALSEADLDWQLSEPAPVIDAEMDAQQEQQQQQQQEGLQVGRWWLPLSDVQSLQQAVAVL